MTNTDFLWTPIKNYEQDPLKLAINELEQLSIIWSEQKVELEKFESLKSFNQQLIREWSIETGLIERIYTLDRGITQILIEIGIDASLISHHPNGQDPELVVAILKDHETALEGLFDFIKDRRILSTSYIKELHVVLTRNQPTSRAMNANREIVEVQLLRGAYKKWPNNPLRRNGHIHNYCPPEQVDMEMENLLKMHAEHNVIRPEVEAAWLHHRFTQIHPFQDGNGRVARCLATLVFLKAGWFPLVISDTRNERPRYIEALEKADNGDLSPLVTLFSEIQKKSFVQALGISSQVKKQHKAEQIIRATRDQLLNRVKAQKAEWQKSKTTAKKIQALAESRLENIVKMIEKETSDLLKYSNLFVDNEPADGDRGHYFKWQIIQAAKQLGYYANLSEYRAWTRLVIRTGSQVELLFSFHATGMQFRGILAVSACFFRVEQTDEGEHEAVDVLPLSKEIFQINYKETPESVEDRFKIWMEDIIITGLEYWRKGI